MENLKSKEIMAIRLRYLGRSYKQISESIKVPVSTLWKWFCRKGRLYSDYYRYVANINKQRTEAFQNAILEDMRKMMEK